MNADDARLLRHLAALVAFKLALLAALWWGFVRDERPAVDAGATAAHLGAKPETRGTQP